MAKTLQIKRGTTAENTAYTGAVGELTMDTSKNTVRIHDGSTQGGTELARSDTTVSHTASSAVGSATQGVYVASDGTATPMTYSVNKTVPSDAVFTDTNTKVTNTLATTTKAYVTGTTSATTNTGTQVFDTGVYLDTTAGQLTATAFKGNLIGNVTGTVDKAAADANGNIIADTYLPLAGGTMTGTLINNSEAPTIELTDTRYNRGDYPAGSDAAASNSGFFRIKSKDDKPLLSIACPFDSDANTAGLIRVYDNTSDTNYLSLFLNTGIGVSGNASKGDLHWTGDNISCTSTEGTYAILDSNTTEAIFYSRENSYNNAALYLRNNSSSKPGSFCLRARHQNNAGNEYWDLLGQYDGTLTWGGDNIVTSTTDGYIVRDTTTRIMVDDDNKMLAVYGGSNISTSPYLALYGTSASSYSGRFLIKATDGTAANSYILTGSPSGSLQWGGKNVVRVEDQGTGYVRFSNNIQLCWGVSTTAANADKKVAFPIEFKSVSSIVYSRAAASTSTADVPIFLRELTTSYFKVYTINTAASGIKYFAVGAWS